MRAKAYNKLQKNMKTTYITPYITAFAFISSATALCAADPVETSLDSGFAQLEEAIPGKFNIKTRLRYEIFDLSAPTPNDRDGSSVSVRYGYTTPSFSGFSAMIEGETVSRVGGDHDDIHPLDDAGDGSDLNQLWIGYKNKDFGSAKVGRQIYTLDDHRFIGHVGWRQNIQTFDGITGTFSGAEKLAINGFYLDQQNAVNATHNDLDALGLNVSYKFGKALQLTGFYYSIEGEDLAAQSNDTFGFRAAGTYMVDELALKYFASYATQNENDGSPVGLNYDADYIAGDISAAIKGITLGAGFEILEPQFRTPLATVHKFNGYADALLPLTGFTNGLEDYYVYAGYKIPVGNGIGLKAIYHWFDSENGASDGGEEIDLVATYKINKYFSVMAKYGDYETDGGVGAGGLQGQFDKKMFTFDLNFSY